MGERLDRTQEVAGSSPASSTSKRPANTGFWFPHPAGEPTGKRLVLKFWVKRPFSDVGAAAVG
jgi:hypothetical protein